MKQTELLADLLNRNFGMLQKLLEDFSDADLLVRPCPGANHAAWQLGHLIIAEYSMLSGVGVAMPELPAGFRDGFSDEKAKVDDPGAFPKKAELLAQFGRLRTASVAWVEGLADQQLSTPVAGEMAAWLPTWGHLAAMLAAHGAMHIGQIQVIRRKLGKPILF